MSRLNRPNHVGKQPVRVLKWNVASQFENLHADFPAEYHKILADHRLEPCIRYDVCERPIISEVDTNQTLIPNVDSGKSITIQETFLSFVWIMCYSHLVLFAEATEKPLLNRLRLSKENIDYRAIKQAQRLYLYGMSLRHCYTRWNKARLPNPELYGKAEAYYIERASGLYRFAISFILCHELAHIKLGHMDQPHIYIPRCDLLLDEMHADDYAISNILCGADTSMAKVNCGMGMLIAFCSLLQLSVSLKNEAHPDADDRIMGILERLNLEDTSPLWGIALVSFKLWGDFYGFKFVWPKEAGNFKALFETMNEQLRHFKAPKG